MTGLSDGEVGAMYEKPYAAGRCPLMRLGKGRSKMWSGSSMTTYFSGMDTVVTHLLSCKDNFKCQMEPRSVEAWIGSFRIHINLVKSFIYCIVGAFSHCQGPPVKKGPPARRGTDRVDWRELRDLQPP